MDFINKKDFRKQIAEDIKEYQELYPTMKNLGALNNRVL